MSMSVVAALMILAAHPARAQLPEVSLAAIEYIAVDETPRIESFPGDPENLPVGRITWRQAVDFSLTMPCTRKAIETCLGGGYVRHAERDTALVLSAGEAGRPGTMVFLSFAKPNMPAGGETFAAPAVTVFTFLAPAGSPPTQGRGG